MHQRAEEVRTTVTSITTQETIMTVYILWHIHELNDDYGTHDEEKLIGIFSTREKAAEAIEAHRNLEGFRDYPVECFEIHEAVVDRSNWNEGFTTVRYEE